MTTLVELLKKAKTPFEKAHIEAQFNAARPVEEGGLGLHPDNTAEDRARAMGYEWDEPKYHGSFYDIKEFQPQKASTESFAGAGTYMTPSPEDASINYASVYGPDVKAKIERELESRDMDYRRMYDKLNKQEYSPSQQVGLAKFALDAHNGGVVYPLVHRSDMTADLGNPKKDSWIDPLETYNEEYDDFEPTDVFHKYERALSNYSNYYGTEPDNIAAALSDEGLSSEGGRAGDWYKTLDKAMSKDYPEDMDGNLISSGVAAAEFLNHLGVDTIKHKTDFGNPQLNIGGEHTIALDPKNVRSRFAAFDPMRKNEANILATHPTVGVSLLGMLGLGGMADKAKDVNLRQSANDYLDTPYDPAGLQKKTGVAPPTRYGDIAKEALSQAPGTGDVLSAMDAYKSLSEGKYGEAALNLAGLMPFVGSLKLKGSKLPVLFSGSR